MHYLINIFLFKTLRFDLDKHNYHCVDINGSLFMISELEVIYYDLYNVPSEVVTSMYHFISIEFSLSITLFSLVNSFSTNINFNSISKKYFSLSLSDEYYKKAILTSKIHYFVFIFSFFLAFVHHAI